MNWLDDGVDIHHEYTKDMYTKCFVCGRKTDLKRNGVCTKCELPQYQSKTAFRWFLIEKRTEDYSMKNVDKAGCMCRPGYECVPCTMKRKRTRQDVSYIAETISRRIRLMNNAKDRDHIHRHLRFLYRDLPNIHNFVDKIGVS